MAENTGEWVQVRVRRSVHAELVVVRDQLYRNTTGQSGRSAYVPSLNDAIEELIRRDRRDRARSRKATAARKAGAAGRTLDAVTVQDDSE